MTLHGVNSRRGGSLVCPRKVCSPNREELSNFMKEAEIVKTDMCTQEQQGAWTGGISIFRSSLFDSYNPG